MANSINSCNDRSKYDQGKGRLEELALSVAIETPVPQSEQQSPAKLTVAEGGQVQILMLSIRRLWEARSRMTDSYLNLNSAYLIHNI